MAVTILGDSSLITELESSFYTKTELNTSGAGGQVHYDNLTNVPSTFTPNSHTHTQSEITDAYGPTSDIYYPSSGVFRTYRDIINRSFCKEKEALLPLMDDDYESGTLPDGKTFSSSNIQVGEFYRVTGTGSISMDGITYDSGEEFKATSTFTVESGNPEVKLGTQHAEFEDCSQIYNPQVIEVGDYYYMYYIGNTQKYQTIGMAHDPSKGYMTEDGITDVLVSDSIQNNADYSRRDQIFLAYKLKSEGLYNGNWTKYKDGREPIISASGEHSGEDDASNAWFRAITYDGSNYIIMYAGDSDTDGSDHTANQMWATSSDGINWTKQGTFTTPSGLSLGTMFYHNSAYYLLVYNTVTENNDLYKSTGDPTDAGTFADSFSLIQDNLIEDASIVYTSIKFNNKIYIGARNVSEGETKIYLYECSDNGTDLESSENWSETGMLYEIPPANSDFTGETYSQLGGSTTANFHSILPVDESTGKWAVFYSYYTHKFARYPWVPETGIRMITFTNPNEPIPSS